MTSLLQNKTLIVHITCEIIVTSILIYWINKRQKNLLNTIEELTNKLNAQNDMIQEHSKLLYKLQLNQNSMLIKNNVVKDNVVKEDMVDKGDTESELDKNISKELAELDDELDISNID